MTPPRFAKRRGVSEVVGALLLIVVVVGAVGSLAVFVGSAQKQAQNRQSYLTNLQDDDLQIAYAQFTPSTAKPALWGSIDLTIRNANTQTSGLSAVELNNDFAINWNQISASGLPIETLGINDPPLVIPARGTVTVALDSASFPPSFGFPFARNSSLTVVLRSSLGNFFTTVYSPPAAIARSSISTQNYGPLTKDTISFDGSQSFATGGSIQNYTWQIDVPKVASGCDDSSFTPGSYGSTTLSGEQSMFTPDLFSVTLFCTTGPIMSILTVTDQNGFTSTSQPLVLPPDPNIDPVASITLASTTPGVPPCSSPTSTCAEMVTLQVNDLFGDPASGAVVNAVPTYGDATPSPLSGATSSDGAVTFTVSWPYGGSGDVSFETDNLLPVQIAFVTPP